MVIWNRFRPFGIHILWSFGDDAIIWYIFHRFVPSFVSRKIRQPCAPHAVLKFFQLPSKFCHLLKFIADTSLNKHPYRFTNAINWQQIRIKVTRDSVHDARKMCEKSYSLFFAKFNLWSHWYDFWIYNYSVSIVVDKKNFHSRAKFFSKRTRLLKAL
jgi:hypothetical protein